MQFTSPTIAEEATPWEKVLVLCEMEARWLAASIASLEERQAKYILQMNKRQETELVR